MAVLALLFAAIGMTASAQVYVDNNPNVPGPRNGSSWANAYANIQTAVNAAGAGVEIWVASGDPYFEGRHTGGDAATGALNLDAGTVLLGGFTGYGDHADGNFNETNKVQRDPLRNETIIDGTGTRTGNVAAYTVVALTGNTVTIDGFVIRNGNANLATTTPSTSTGEQFRGGGMFIDGRTAINVLNCQFRNNNAIVGGGGMAILNCAGSGTSAVTVKGCIFQSNTGTSSGTPVVDKGLGGAIMILRSQPVIDSNIFRSNVARYGSGIYAVWAKVGPGDGGSILKPVIQNNLFYLNQTNEGGTIYNLVCQSEINHNTLIANSVTGSSNESPVVSDVNRSAGIISHNPAQLPRTGGTTVAAQTPNCLYNIVQDNAGATGSAQIVAITGSISNLASNTTSGATFLGAGSRDYRLASPLNTATPILSPAAPPRDGFGVLRPNGTVNDRGAYERETVAPVLTVTPISVNVGTNNEVVVHLNQVASATDSDESLVFSFAPIGIASANAPTYGSVINHGTLVPTVRYTCSNLGPQTATVYVADSNGNTANANVTITVTENIPPTLVTANPGPINVGPSDVTLLASQFVSSAVDTPICGGTVTTSISKTFNASGTGYTGSLVFGCADENASPVTVHVRAVDLRGNVTNSTVSLVVRDQAGPVITTANPSPVTLNAGGSIAVPATSFGSALDRCDGARTLSVRRGSDSFAPAVLFTCSDIGNPVTVDITASDSAVPPNTTTTQVVVTVVDGTAPSITILSPAPIQVGNGDVVVPASTFATATDSCSTPTVEVRLNGSSDPFGPSVLFTCTQAGATVDVDVRATDGSGNQSFALASVAAQDNVAPTAPAIGTNITLSLDASGSISLSESDVATIISGAADTCGVDLAATLASANPGSFDCTDLGGNPVVMTVRDRSGNPAGNTTTATVTIQDTLPPTAIAQSGVITVFLSSPTLTGIALNDGSTDNCSISQYQIDGNPSRTFTCANVGAPFGVTLTVIDGSGNSASTAATVRVEDDVDPVASCVAGPITLPLGAVTGTATLNPAALNSGSSDNCTASGSLVFSLSQTNFNCSHIGSPIPVTLTVADAAGNEDTCVVNVNVVDQSPPVITLTGGPSIAILQFDTFTDPGFNVVDNCDPTPIITTGGTVNTSVLGPYQLTYDAEDTYGNIATQVVRTVTVVPDPPPVITLTGANPLNFECGSAGVYTDPGATAFDVPDGVLTPTIQSSNVVPDTLGQYQVIWQVTDSEPTTVTETRIVNVVDTTGPTISDTAGPETRECSIGYTLAEARAAVTISDLCNTPPNSDLVITAVDALNAPASFPLSGIGAFTLTYTVMDASNNLSAPLQRTVTLIDTTPPVLTDVAGPQTLQCPGPYTLAAARAAVSVTDNCATISTGSITVSATRGVDPVSFPLTEVGVYTLGYQASDGFNIGTAVRTVTIEDTIRPVISLIGSSTIVIFRGSPFTDPGVTVTDSCETGLSATVGGDVVDINTAGDYFVTYDAVDSEGNQAITVTRRVTVTGLGGPPIIVTHPQPRTVDFHDDATFTVVASGQGTLTYQWRKLFAPLSNNAKYSGVNTPTLTVIDPENADEGDYSVVVTNDDGSTPSNPALLTVRDPSIVSQPVDVAVGIGVNAQFQVQAVGSGTLTYQWFRLSGVPLVNGAKFAGVTTDTLTVLNAQIADEEIFYVEVTGADGMLRSNNAELQVGDPIIVTNPISQVVPPGTTVNFSVVATGTLPFNYVWQRNGVNMTDGGRISGSRSPNLTITNVNDTDEASYRCRVVGINVAESAGATLTVGNVPIIDRVIVSPANGAIPIGGFLSMTVVMASGDTPFTYQWYRNGVPLSNSGNVSGATGATLSIVNAVLGNAGSYAVVVANSVGNDQSTPVSISVGLRFLTNLPDATVIVDQPFNWRVVMGGGLGVITFQWFRETDAKAFVPVSGPNILGEASDNLQFDPVTYDDAGRYYVIATDGFGPVQSRTARLNVVAGLPVAGGAGLALAALLMGAAGAVLRRGNLRRKG